MEYLPGLSEEKLRELVPLARNIVLVNDGVMRSKDNPNSSDRVECIPFTMLPTPFPRELFNMAVDLQTDYNILYHRISHDYEFLKDSLKAQISGDDFVKRLWKIAEHVHGNGVVQPVCLVVNRNDYMVDTPESGGPSTIKQVEFNTFAVTSGSKAKAVSSMHRFLLDHLGYHDVADKHLLDKDTSTKGYAEGLVTAWETYGNQQAKIVMVADDPSPNRIDQRIIQYEVYKKNRRVQMLLYTLPEIAEKAVLTEDKRLIIDGYEVAVLYYRAGYSPDHYTSEKVWDARMMMENSRAIKAPCIFCQLCGTKKIQQSLCAPGVVERYLGEGDVAKRIRETFAMQYSFEGPDRDLAIRLALEQPERYVMKPSREGGGNNVYSDDMVALINMIKNTDELENYVLMELIRSKPVRNYLVTGGLSMSSKKVIGELGICSYILGSRDEILGNSVRGQHLKTKVFDSKEGGVSVGKGAVDYIFLV